MTTTDRWAPRLGATVRFRETHEHEDDLPSGTWKLISRNDRGPAHWWAMAISTDARAWVLAHPGVTLSGCVDADGRDLLPVNGIRI